MNDQIRELLVQAEDLADTEHSVQLDKGVPDLSWVNIYSEKIAEVILAEALQHLTNIGYDASREALEKHFGVKA